MNNFLKFYIKSSVHVALAVVAFSIVTCLNFNIPVDVNLTLFIFFGTITGYNFVKYAPLVIGGFSNLQYDYRDIWIITTIAFVGLIITAYFLSETVLLISGLLGCITILYALPVFSRNRNLRAIPGLKIYIIVFVVAGVTVILPLISSINLIPSRDIMVEFFQRCIIAVVLILPFEIRDLKQDISFLQTIPQKYGVVRTKNIGYILIGITLLLEFTRQEIYLKSLIGLVFISIIAYLFLKFSSIDQREYYSSFWVEAAPIFWMIAILITDNFISFL